ncbi:MAG TPA: ATP-binding protein [Anaerolineales bacterium]|nr:ATP-binding protein [Anaerolineales bacterium]
MDALLPCPNCNQLVSQQVLECPHCGVNLALAAVIGEQQVISKINKNPTIPITPEIFVPRVGELLIERGVLTQEDLQRALDYSKKPGLDGQQRLVGQALLELKLIDRETLDQVITEQILRLHTALQQSNIRLEQRVKERTQELQSALNKLAELNQLKSNFISNVSHELRTPLTHIRGYLDLMYDGLLGELSKEQTTALDVMLRSEARLEELIDKMIQFSLEATGQFTLQIKPGSLCDVVTLALKQAKIKAADRPITLAIDLGADNYLVKMDHEKIQWVVMELVDNAIKFTPPGGKVSIKVEKGANFALVHVDDTGIGISSERLSEIFEPYHQLDGSSTRRYGGIGLGLALVKKIIEAHGSQVVVNSVLDRGTSITFQLPLTGAD